MTDFVVDGQAIWNLRPAWIPGQVKRTRDNTISIDLKVPLRGLDGNELKEVECSQSLSPRLTKGQLVLLSLALDCADAQNIHSQNDGLSRQRVIVDEIRIAVEPAAREEHKAAIKDYANSYAQNFFKLISGIEKKVEDLATAKAESLMAPERDFMERAWIENTENTEKCSEDRRILEIAFSALAIEQAGLLTVHQESASVRQELEQDKLDFEECGGSKLIGLLRQLENADDHEQQTYTELQEMQTPATIISDLRKHFDKQNYLVDDDLLLQTLLCLCVGAATGQFVVLSGPPGSGKTSLVQKIARAIGAGNGVVPVRPAWIDATDLIGFYNPTINRYQPTAFLDHILRAKRASEANRLYLLVLDEMNLGRIENYAADFLALMEKSKEGGQHADLQLYSTEIGNRFRDEHDDNEHKFKVGEGRNPLPRRAALIKHTSDYPSRLPLPKSLVLLGTINLDETTHLPSPKFLDRSLTIQVSGTVLPKELTNINAAADTIFPWVLSLATAQKCRQAGEELSQEAVETWDLLLKWNEKYFKLLGIRLSHRLPQVFRCYVGAASILNISDHRAVADTFVLCKILPLISFRKEDTTRLELLKAWGEEINSKYTMDSKYYPRVYAALKKMQDFTGTIVRYLE